MVPCFRFSLNLWLYSTCDNVDGKQARRTHSSSPLGELFDHGVDSLSCSIGCIVQMAAMASGNSFQSVAMFTFITFLFYLGTWEHFHTGVMYMGIINGPTEGIILVCMVLMIPGLVGPTFWRRSIDNYLFTSVLSLFKKNADLTDALLLILVMASFLFAVPPR
jgi:ethanolaminephosphotransferase